MNTLKRVLIATDGSERGRMAVDLAAAIVWPEDTEIEVLEVNEPPFQGTELPLATVDALERDVRERIDADLALARCRLVAAAPMTETITRRGRAATEIVREAERLAADLVIVGSRGRGPIVTMLLGSVAAEVVDRVTCPIFVARRPRLRRMVVADDGSAVAALAVKTASLWPIFKGVPARAVSVAPVPAFTGVGPMTHEPARQSYAEGVDALRAIHAGIAAGQRGRALARRCSQRR